VDGVHQRDRQSTGEAGRQPISFLAGYCKDVKVPAGEPRGQRRSRLVGIMSHVHPSPWSRCPLALWLSYSDSFMILGNTFRNNPIRSNQS